MLVNRITSCGLTSPPRGVILSRPEVFWRLISVVYWVNLSSQKFPALDSRIPRLSPPSVAFSQKCPLKVPGRIRGYQIYIKNCYAILNYYMPMGTLAMLCRVLCGVGGWLRNYLKREMISHVLCSDLNFVRSYRFNPSEKTPSFFLWWISPRRLPPFCTCWKTDSWSRL